MQNLKKDEPVTLKAYKYNNKFSQSVSSTCPIVPKHHRTFGRPSLYEKVSDSIDHRTQPDFLKSIKDSLTIKRDRLVVNKEAREIKVLNEFGHEIMYTEALNDLLEVEEEILKIGSYYINHHEYLQASNDIAGPHSDTFDESDRANARHSDRPSSLIDRAQIACDLFSSEFEFQFEKVALIEQMLEVLEHTVDPLDCVRHMQSIFDTMAARPRLNLESTLYKESYVSEIEVMRQKTTFFSEFIALQKRIEQEANLQVQNFQELKKRRVNEIIAGEVQFNEHRVVTERPGSDEREKEGDASQMQERLRIKALRDKQHEMGIANIKAKHITEFANE